MKIVESGITHAITCGECGSKLEITYDDIDYAYVMGHADTKNVTCPVCEKYIRLHGEKLPEIWEKKFLRIAAEQDGDF
ncbi:MAG: hypothetical protein KAS32_01795 [Candidatus Peribacteraceae bacterium]|nr:hypothetical protein [Candidatus Peribacteraceae bacterium]